MRRPDGVTLCPGPYTAAKHDRVAAGAGYHMAVIARHPMALEGLSDQAVHIGGVPSGSVVALLGAYRREHGITVVMVTHEIPPRPGSLTVSPMSPPAAGRPARPAR